LHDRDTKFCPVFRVRSAKGEALSKLISFGEASLRRALTEFIDHYHGERNHQGKGSVLLFPRHEVAHEYFCLTGIVGNSFDAKGPEICNR